MHKFFFKPNNIFYCTKATRFGPTTGPSSGCQIKNVEKIYIPRLQSCLLSQISEITILCFLLYCIVAVISDVTVSYNNNF